MTTVQRSERARLQRTISVRGTAGRVAALLALAIAVLASVPAAWPVARTYTLDADFDEGLLVNVNHDSPNNDQLQLNSITTPFPFVNIACSARGTIVRIDVNTGAVLGEYRTAPDGRVSV
jgi:hypothetical protein